MGWWSWSATDRQQPVARGSVCALLVVVRAALVEHRLQVRYGHPGGGSGGLGVAGDSMLGTNSKYYYDLKEGYAGYRDSDADDHIEKAAALLEADNPTIRKLAFKALTQITGATFDTAEQWRAWAVRVGLDIGAEPDGGRGAPPHSN